MKPLLALDSPTYLRRLVRELNGLPDRFYFGGTRYTRAAYRKGILCLRFMGCGERPRNYWAHVAIPESAVFSDAYGRTVTASRATP